MFQPIIDLRAGTCVGYEAVHHVGAQGLRLALDRRASLPTGCFLMIPQGPVDLADPQAQQVLDQVDPAGLVAGLHEPEAILAEPATWRRVEALRGSGLMVALPVREGGWAELDRIRSIRPDLVTLVAPLATGVDDDPVRRRLIAITVHVAGEVGAGCLASGVEREADARALQGLGVALGQGWLFGRARPGFLLPEQGAPERMAQAWQENVIRSGLGTLVQPLPESGGQPTTTDAPPLGWRADLGPGRRLRALIDPDGTRVAASTLVRLRVSTQLRAAARRVVQVQAERGAAPLFVVVADDGAFLGVADTDTLLRRAVTLAADDGDENE